MLIMAHATSRGAAGATSLHLTALEPDFSGVLSQAGAVGWFQTFEVWDIRSYGSDSRAVGDTPT